MDVEKEHSTFIDRPGRSKNSWHPLEQIVAFWPSTEHTDAKIQFQ